MTTLKISVVIPLFNKASFVNECIRSVLSQIESNFELIIIDDGSTDSSVAIVGAYDDKRIRLISQKNQGVAVARNRGVAEANGEWIAFIDADDVWAENHLHELIAVIKKFSDAGIVSTRSTEFFGKAPLKKLKVSYNWPQYEIDFFKVTAVKSGIVHSSSVAIKRSVFDVVGNFKSFSQGEDTEFWARVCLVYPCAVSDAPTSFYRRATGGIMETNAANKIDSYQPVQSIHDLGPAVSYLMDEIDGGGIPDNMRDSVAIFINSRITTALRILLYSGRVGDISLIGNCYMKPLSMNNRIWRVIASFPERTLTVIYSARSVVRAMYRTLRA